MLLPFIPFLLALAGISLMALVPHGSSVGIRSLQQAHDLEEAETRPTLEQCGD